MWSSLIQVMAVVVILIICNMAATASMIDHASSHWSFLSNKLLICCVWLRAHPIQMGLRDFSCFQAAHYSTCSNGLRLAEQMSAVFLFCRGGFLYEGILVYKSFQSGIFNGYQRETSMWFAWAWCARISDHPKYQWDEPVEFWVYLFWAIRILWKSRKNDNRFCGSSILVWNNSHEFYMVLGPSDCSEKDF